MRFLIALVLLAGCGGSDEISVEDGTYRVEGADCATLKLSNGALTLSWFGESCTEPSLLGGFEEKVMLRTTGCGHYPAEGDRWILCPGPGYLEGSREESGEVVFEFEAFPW